MPFVRLRPAAFAVLCAFGISAFAADVPLSADTYVSTAAMTANYGAGATVNVAPNATALLRFNLNVLPAGTVPSQVQKALLVLYVNRVGAPGAVDVQTVGSVWSESSVTAATAPVNLRYDNPVSAEVATAGQYVTIDVTDKVIGWLTSGEGSNFGFSIQPAAVAPNTTVFFDSKENTLTGHGARLDVTLASTSGSGNAGPMGPTGPSGPQGPQGVKGDTGAAGATGAIGPQGQKGDTGAMGATGVKGDPGAPGAQGVKGDTGAIGPQGAKGDTGSAGPTGPMGGQGLKGDTGAVGPAGSVGVPGPQGPQGIAGFPGPTGSAGPAGPEGPAGPGGSGVTWVNVTTTTQQAQPNTAYVANAIAVAFTLPSAPAIGDVVSVTGTNKSDWTIIPNAGQTIVTQKLRGSSSATTTAPLHGSFYDAIELQYIGNNRFTVLRATETVTTTFGANQMFYGGLTWVFAAITVNDYSTARVYCSTTINGLSDWRLPSAAELEAAATISAIPSGWRTSTYFSSTPAQMNFITQSAYTQQANILTYPGHFQVSGSASGAITGSLDNVYPALTAVACVR